MLLFKEKLKWCRANQRNKENKSPYNSFFTFIFSSFSKMKAIEHKIGSIVTYLGPLHPHSLLYSYYETNIESKLRMIKISHQSLK